MGTADAIPGISGGTVALILGIYDRLVAAISELSFDNATTVAASLSPREPANRASTFRTVFDRIDGAFLLALGAGIATGVITVAELVSTAAEETPVALFAFFFGLILASGLLLFRDIRPFDRHEAVAAGLGILIAGIVSGELAVGIDHSLPIVFLAGMIAFSAMLLPGISGSLLLLILGQYEFMTTRLSDFLADLANLSNGGSLDPLIANGTIIVTFLAGGALGVLSVARVVDRALEWNRQVTIAFLVGLVLGALRAPAQKVQEGVAAGSQGGLAAWTTADAGWVAGWILVGSALVVFIDRSLYRITV